MKLDKLQMEKYKKHPRVMEIRFILLFELIEQEYDYHQAVKFFESLCEAFRCNIVFLQSIINQRYDIKRNSKKDFVMWRQEIIFVYTLYGESLYKIAKTHLGIKPETLYAQSKLYDINKFCDENWLNKLDMQVTLCGEKSYRLEMTRFFEALDMFADIMILWKGSEK